MEAVWQTPGVQGLLFLLLFLAGYASGRRQGKREGFVEGVRFSPLEMRRQTWERGHCVICGNVSCTQCDELEEGQDFGQVQRNLPMSPE